MWHQVYKYKNKRWESLLMPLSQDGWTDGLLTEFTFFAPTSIFKGSDDGDFVSPDNPSLRNRDEYR